MKRALTVLTFTSWPKNRIWCPITCITTSKTSENSRVTWKEKKEKDNCLMVFRHCERDVPRIKIIRAFPINQDRLIARLGMEVVKNL
ncbi:MAG: hypothetical protein ACXAEU_02440 [Candidatus Hodarchaeales archaeon]